MTVSGFLNDIHTAPKTVPGTTLRNKVFEQTEKVKTRLAVEYSQDSHEKGYQPATQLEIAKCLSPKLG